MSWLIEWVFYQERSGFFTILVLSFCAFIHMFFEGFLVRASRVVPWGNTKKHINNKDLLKICTLLLKITYTVFCIVLAIILFKVIFPF